MEDKKKVAEMGQKKELMRVGKGEIGIHLISDERLQAILDLRNDQTLWAKVIQGGFTIIRQDKFIKDIIGHIVDADPYLIRFENGVPSKLPHVANDLDIPEGYERRCDVKILVGDQLIGLPLPPSSFLGNLKPYIEFLNKKGLRPENVITRVFSKQASNSKGTWPVACFELVGNGQSTEPSSKLPPEWVG